VDCYVGPPPEESPGKELVVEKLFDQSYVVLGRKGHPLSQARSLRELIDADWLTHATTFKVKDELGPLFAQFKLPPPRLVMQSHSALTFLMTVAHSDLLMMLPSTWADTPLARELLQKISVVETLPCAPVCIIRRVGLPLTPAAEYFCDMMRRASVPMAGAKRGRIRSGWFPS
jgi:DNA-binding transcriptional LysR family regulator